MMHHQHSHRDFISLLPKKGLYHVAENILSYLDAKSLCAAELVSKDWYQVISEGMFWRKLIERRVQTDSLWRRLIERQDFIKYLFKPSPGMCEPHPDPIFYRRLYPKIIQDFENIETNWRCGRPTLKRIDCQSENSEGACCVRYDDQKIVSGLYDNTIKVWDRNTLECIQVLTGHNDPVQCLHYNDRLIISGSSDATGVPTVKFWDIKTGKLINTLFPPSGTRFTLSLDNTIIVYLYEHFTEFAVSTMLSHSKITKTSLLSHDHIDAVVLTEVPILLKAKYYAFCDSSRRITVVNACPPHERVRFLKGHKGGVVCIHQCGRLAVTGSMDKTIRLWDIERGACLRILEGHKAFVTCVQFDNKRIVSCASDGVIKIWDLAAALNPRAPARTLCLGTLAEHSGSISSLWFDDFQIVSSSSDDTILIWDFLDGTPLETSAMNICLTYMKNVYKTNCHDVFIIFLYLSFIFALFIF